MPIDPNIALGVRPIEQPNMLGQMGQMMALRSAQQEYEGQNALRDAFASGGNLNDPAFIQRLRAANPKMALDIEAKHLAGEKTRSELLGNAYKNSREALTTVNSPESLRAYTISQFSDPIIGPALKAKGMTPEAALANLDAEIAKSGFDNVLKKSAMGLDSFFKDQTSRANAVTATGPAYARLAYDIKNPTQHYFTGEDNTLMGVSTRGGGAAAPVPVAGANAPPPQITMGGGGTTPMGGGSSIMVNPASVNAFAPVSQNALITQPQPAATPAAPAFAKVRAAPSAITHINAFAPASETAQAEFMKGSRATFDQLKQASTVLDNIERAKALVPTAKGFMGTGGETMLETAKFMNNRLGTSIDTAGIKSAEELNSRLFMGIMDNLKKMDAQPSQQQQAAMKQALGSLGTDPSAMNSVLDVFGDIVRGKVDIYNQEVTGAEARGIKFPYDPVIKLQGRTPASTGDIATDAGVAKVIKSNAEYNALPSGTTFTAPDGSTRRKP
jgi:hypothetical protein